MNIPELIGFSVGILIAIGFSVATFFKALGTMREVNPKAVGESRLKADHAHAIATHLAGRVNALESREPRE